MRSCSVIGLIAAFALAAETVTLTAQAKAGAAPRAEAFERTPDGHPDFQGVWANNTVTPLQRPKQWEGKDRLTDAEVNELQKFAAQITDFITIKLVGQACRFGQSTVPTATQCVGPSPLAAVTHVEDALNHPSLHRHR